MSDIETGAGAARLYEAWIDKRSADGSASVRFGLYDLNSEFDTTEAGALSLLSSHGIGPDFAQSGRNGPSIFPVTSLALRGECDLGDRWLVRTGLLRRGRDDKPGLTVAHASSGGPYRRSLAATGVRADRNETVVEPTYRTSLAPWLTVQPDVQYLIDPGGDPTLRDALALGLRVEAGL